MTPDSPTETPTPLDVKYETISFTITGAFMIAMSREAPADFPTTVEAFITLLGNYARKYSGILSSEAGKLARSPNITREQIDGPLYATGFTPLPEETGDDPLGVWEVENVLQVRNVRRGASMKLFQNSADHVNIRLPEPNNIAAKEGIAEQHQADGTLFPKMDYIDPYFSGQMTAMQFVWANVGDYTTRSCR